MLNYDSTVHRGCQDTAAYTSGVTISLRIPMHPTQRNSDFRMIFGSSLLSISEDGRTETGTNGAIYLVRVPNTV